MKNPTPAPETTTALLISAGYKGPRKPTHHKYVRTERVEVPSRKPGLPPTFGYAFVFACAETGAERRFGLERVPGERGEVAP